MKRSLRSLLLIAVCLSSLMASVARSQEIINGDFGGDFQAVKVPADSKSHISGDVAMGWRDESAWGDVTIIYSKDATGGHNGVAQKIEVSAINQGGVQFVQELKFAAGTTYHVKAWIKAAAAGEILVSLRQSGPPYTTFASTKIEVSTEWAQVEVTGQATVSENGLIMFNPSGPGTYWISGVTFEAVK